MAFDSILSCETQLISLFQKLAFNHDQGIQTDFVSTDFTKAFNTVPTRGYFMSSTGMGYGVMYIIGWLIS